MLLPAAFAILLLAGQPGDGAPSFGAPAITMGSLLGQEAVYLITPDERDEFNQLESDSERHSFAQQFWLRRGIDFQQEYTRRIAQANQRFTVTGPGWQSDRGRAFLILGDPESVEVKPEMKAEVWQYKDFELRFSGFTQDGDYSLILPRGVSRSRTMDRLRLVTAP